MNVKPPPMAISWLPSEDVTSQDFVGSRHETSSLEGLHVSFERIISTYTE